MKGGSTENGEVAMAKVKQASAPPFKARSLKPDFSDVRHVSEEVVGQVQAALRASEDGSAKRKRKQARKRRQEAQRELEKRLK